MDDGKSDRDSLPEHPGSAEADRVENHISSLTRRSFLVGAGSVSSAYATGVFAETTPVHRWVVYRASDPQAEGRSVLAVCFDNRASTDEDLHWCFLPEVSFGEYTKLTIQPLPSNTHTANVYDVQAVFSGLELARPENKGSNYFSLIFRFINPVAKTPQENPVEPARVEIVARSLLSSGERLLAQLCLKDWRSAAPIKIKDSQLGPALLDSVFSTRLRPPRCGKIDLSLVRPTDQDRRLIWRFQAASPTATHASGFSVVADCAAKLSDGEFRRVMVGSSSSVEMWRAHSALDSDAQAQSANAAGAMGKPAATKAPPALNTPAPTAKAAPKPTPPRTIAQLTSFRPNDSALVAGEYELSNGHYSRLVLDQLDIDDSRPVQLVRRDPSGYPCGIKINDKISLKVAIDTTIPIGSGELSVRTTRTKKTERKEGPFRLDQGTIMLAGAADHSPLLLDADFQLGCHNTSLLTAFGPFEVERPEDKRVRRRNASNFADEGTGDTHGSQYELRRPVRLSVKDRVITAFEATARVNSVGVALSKPSTPAIDDHSAYRVDLGFPQGCEVLFRLFGLNDSANTRRGIGRVSLGTSPEAVPAKGTFAGPYALPLDNGVLRLRRWRDLICLNYRFAGIDLVQEDDGKAYLTPRGLARQVSFDSPPNDATGKFADPDVGPAPFDPRAMMVVEFPSQHVAEEAFFEQRIARPAPPRYPASLLQDKDQPELAKKFDKLRSLYLSQNPRVKPAPDSGKLDAKAKKRIALRNDLQAAVTAVTSPADDVKKFSAFWDEFKKVNTGLPAEQQLYVGDEFLDPEARRAAEIAANALIVAKGDLFDRLPDDPVSQQDIGATVSHLLDFKPTDSKSAELHDAVVKELMKDKQIRNVSDPAVKELVEKAALILDNLRRSRDPFFVAFQREYKNQSKNIPRFNIVKFDDALSSFSGRTQLRDTVEEVRKEIEDCPKKTPPDPTVTAKRNALEAFKTFVGKLIDSVQDDMGLSGDEEPTPMSRARLSGPSRLAFRINTDDFETGDHGGRIEFSVSELTNWSRHELVVIRRAQKLLKSYADGSRRPLWDMQEDHDLATQLVQMGFSRGGWADRSKSKNGTPRNWSQATVTAEQRLAEVAASAATAPGPFETAIEMPFRLFLSPSQDGRFRTRRDVPSWVLSPTKDTGKAPGIVEPLWRAAFEVEPNSALRAIWSPDFRPEAFVPMDQSHGCLSLPCPSRANRPPMRGPYAPWAMGRETSDNPIPPDIVEAPRFRTSLDAFDRHELVTLSSLHGLPVIGKVGTDAQNNIVRLGKDQVEPPEGFQVSTPDWEGVADDKRQLLPTLNDIYLPKILDPKGMELALSSLGGYLRVNANFDPPASILNGKGQDYYNALSIERWRHNIVLGRDISAEVVYKGYLFPIGLHCTLIKITERRFQKVEGRKGPTAVLRQRMFLRIGNPTKNFPAFQQPDAGRRVPFRALTVVTTQTPDIVDPYDVTGLADENHIYPSGRIKLDGDGVSGTAFWPRTSKRFGGEVKFDLLVDGNIPTRMPLIFVDNTAANSKDAIAKLCEHYNGLGASPTFVQVLTQAGFAGAKLTYAPESKAGDTQFETQSLVFGAEGRSVDGAKFKPKEYLPFQKTAVANANFVSDPFMQGADQPPFYPAMRFATVKIGQIERLVGHPLPLSRVGYDPSYALYGFPDNGGQLAAAAEAAVSEKKPDNLDAANPKEIFLSLIDQPDLTFGQGGDKGGGVSRPEMTIYALSRKAGPISASPPAPPPPSPQAISQRGPDFDQPNPITAHLNDIKDDRKALATSFFGDNATLLGLIKLSDLIEAIITLAGGRVPVLQELVDYGGGLAGDADAAIRERVLEPLQQALASLNDPMTKQIPLGATGQTVEVSKVYPDVVRAYTALTSSVQAALDAPPPEDGPGDTISAYTAVYTDGRSFVNAIERALRDPLTPLRDAAKNWLNDRIAAVKQQFDDAVTAFQPILGNIDPRGLRSRLRSYLATTVLTQLQTLLFVLPPPSTPFATPDAATWADLTETFYLSLADALKRDDVWPGDRDDSQPFFAPKKFQEELATAFADRAQGKTGDVWPQQIVALNRMADHPQDLLVPETAAILNALDQATRGFKDFQSIDPSAVTAVLKIVDPFADSFKQLKLVAQIGATIESLGVTLVNQCTEAVAAINNLIAAALPTATAPAAALLDPAIDAFNRLAAGLSSLNAQAQSVAVTSNLDPVLAALKTQLNTAAVDKPPTVSARTLSSSTAKDLAKLKEMILSFANEQASFDPAICNALPTQLPWQLQRLLGYLRGLSNQAARCIGGAQNVMDSLAEILKDPATNILFLQLPTYPILHPLPVGGDPSIWQPFTSPANDDDESRYWIDLLRQRYFYVTAQALAAAANVLQGLSFAGVILDAGPSPGPRLVAFNALSATVGKIVNASGKFNDPAERDAIAKLLTYFQKVYSADPAAISKRVKLAVDDLIAASTALTDLLDGPSAAINARLVANATALAIKNDKLISAAQDVVSQVVGAVDRAIGTGPFGLPPVDASAQPPIQALLTLLLDRIAGQFQGAVNGIVQGDDKIAGIVTTTIVTPLASIYDDARNYRDELFKKVSETGKDLGPVTALVGNALIAPKDRNLDVDHDALFGQDQKIDGIASALKYPSEQLSALVDLFDFIKSWKSHAYEDSTPPVGGPNAVLFIADQAKDLVTNLVRDVLKGDLGKILDFAAIKSDVERRLRELIPSKVTLAYDFDTELQDVLDIFLPEDGSRLTLKARTVIDVLNGGSPQVTASGELGPFSVKILGGFLDIVTLSFDGAKFGSETGGKLKANVIDVQLGEAVSFLQAVSSFFSFGANGFYLSVLFDPPGIEAGYRMPPCGFALGVLGISNISLNAAAVLPFDGTPAMFKVGLSRPESPFLINVAVYGGGGHLSLYSTSQGIIGFESSFEFGAVVAFAIGPLTGNARITVGIFLRSFKSGGRTLSTIEGYTTVAGSASISIFRFSAMLQVRVGQQPNGEMVGTAIFTFSFSMGIKDIEFRVTAHKSMGKGYSSNPDLADAGDAIDPSRKLIQLASNLPYQPVASDVGDWAYTVPSANGADCKGEDGKKPCSAPVAHLIYRAVCKGENYAKYQSYFDDRQPWQPAFF